MHNYLSRLLPFLFVPLNVFSQSDSPCSAPILTVNTDTCVFIASTTVGASYDTTNGGTPPCAFPGSPDVWYAVVVPPSGAMAITSEAGTITDGGMAVYSGPCNNLQFIECDDDDAVNFMAVVDRSDYIPGDTIYVRFWKAAGSGTGTFSICALESHSDCRVAVPLCETVRVNGNAYGPGSNQDAFAIYCDISEFQSMWFKFRFLTAGIFNFKIFPDSLAIGIYPDYDWLLYQSGPGFCNSFTSSTMPYACNGSSSMGTQGETGLDPLGTSNSVPGGPGNPYCPLLTVNAGDEYYLLINNFSTSSTGFELRIGGTALLDCNWDPVAIQSPNETEPVNIYPVPAHENICFNTGKHATSLPWRLEVFDETGRLILSREINNGSETCVPGEQIGHGIFLYRLRDSEWQHSYSRKFLID